MHKIADQAVHEANRVFPGAAHIANRSALLDFAFFSDNPANPFEFLGHPLIHLHDIIESVGDFSGDPQPIVREPLRKVPFFQSKEPVQETS